MVIIPTKHKSIENEEAADNRTFSLILSVTSSKSRLNACISRAIDRSFRWPSSEFCIVLHLPKLLSWAV